MDLLRIVPLFVALVAGCHSSCRGSAGAGQAPAGGSADGDVTLPGVDTGSLTPREKRDWSTMVTELLAPCPSVQVSVAQCAREGRTCVACLPAAKLLVKQVRAGRSRSQAEDAFFSRFAADRVRKIDLDGSPSKGPESAPITVVEWADFECPHCKSAGAVFEKLVEDFPDKIRFVFKLYPLPGHPHGDSTARAAVAALNQGKFWEMHHTLFAHQQALEPKDVEGYAKDIGIDLKKFRADIETEATVDRIQRDRKQAEKLAITGTPTVYINGREYHFGKFDVADDLTDWIKLEIELTGNK
jgi:thiol-disulfide isomerase/thioredoxin